MRKVYWRPKSVSRTALTLIAGFAVAGLIIVESRPITNERPYQQEKLDAANLAAEGFEAVYYARAEFGPPIDPTTDPTESGLIGLPMSPVTSISGHLAAKQTSVNPNFAAVIVDMLKKSGVKEGDTIAVGVSGSFPALNLCVYAAVETLKLNPIVIASAAASQWGANCPDLLWIDMERVLKQEGIFGTRAIACSIGGYEDRGLGMTEDGLELIRRAIERNDLPVLESETFEEAVDKRMAIYKDRARGKPIKAYINVGGGTISVGRSLGKRLFNPGLNMRAPVVNEELDGIMPRFAAEGVPVVHMIHIATLANRFGLEFMPAAMPTVGQANVFEGMDYNRPLAAVFLVVEVALLYTFIRSDIGFRLLRSSGQPKNGAAPEPMV